MSDELLRQSLTELRSELERLEAEEAEVRKRLDALVAGIETRLDTPDDTAPPSFACSGSPPVNSEAGSVASQSHCHPQSDYGCAGEHRELSERCL